MKKFGKIWPVLFSLLMMAFVFFIGWQIYATASVKSRTAEAEEDLKRQKGMLKLQQVEAEKSLAEIAYYQDMIDDLMFPFELFQLVGTRTALLACRKTEFIVKDLGKLLR